MYAQVHPAVAIQSHPGHQSCGGYFVAPEETEQQGSGHRIRRMRRAETIQTARVTANEMNHPFKRRFMCWTQAADQRFDDARAGVIAQSDRYGKAR